MIQRVQSLFLAAIACLMGTFLFVAIWEKQTSDGTIRMMLTSFRMVTYKDGNLQAEVPVIWLAALAIGVGGLAIYALLSFKNRMRQMQLCIINSLLLAVLLGAIIYHAFEGEKLLPNASKGSYGLGFLIPALALIFNMLANRFIRKDEEAVRESNRMR